MDTSNQSGSDLARLLGRNVARARVDARLSFDDLSAMIGLSPLELVKIELGFAMIKPDTLIRASTALGVPIRNFFAKTTPVVHDKNIGDGEIVSELLSIFRSLYNTQNSDVGKSNQPMSCDPRS